MAETKGSTDRRETFLGSAAYADTKHDFGHGKFKVKLLDKVLNQREMYNKGLFGESNDKFEPKDYKGEDDFTWEVIERKTPAFVFDLMKDFDGSKYITPVDLAADKKISGDIKIMGGLTVHRGDMFMINDFTDSRIYNKVDEKSFTTEEKKKIINNCKGGCAIVCEAKIVGKYGGDAVLKISKINSIDLLLK